MSVVDQVFKIVETSGGNGFESVEKEITFAIVFPVVVNGVGGIYALHQFGNI